MTILENLKDAVQKLNQVEIDNSIMKARVLLAFVLNKSKEYLIINENYELSNEEQKQYEIAVERLKGRRTTSTYNW